MHVSRAAMAARLLPQRWLSQVELLAMLAQGKGWHSTTAQEIEAVRTLLGSKAYGPLVVLDGGANVGHWTRAALAAFPGAQIHAFEPSSTAVEALRSTVGADPRVSVHQLALSNETGQATLYSHQPGAIIGSLSKRRLARIEFDHQESVSMVTLSEWARSAGVDTVDVLKLDIEGFELDALRGADGLLGSISVIQFEFSAADIDTRTYFQDFWYLLTEAGRRLYRLGPTGLHPVERYAAQDEVFITTNYFVV